MWSGKWECEGRRWGLVGVWLIYLRLVCGGVVGEGWVFVVEGGSCCSVM